MNRLFVCVLLAAAAVSAQEMELVWEDNFDTFDSDKWQWEITAWGGGNAEFQTYIRDENNAYVENGHLFMRATKLSEAINPQTGQPYGEEFLQSGTLDLNALYGDCTMGEESGCFRIGQDIPPIASARIRTYEKFAFRYGRAEIRARMPVGDWLWPAMWLLPEDWMYGGWPESGEIDIVESIGNRDFKCNNEDRGIQHIGATLHWGANPNANRYYLTTGTQDNLNQNYADFFHDYVLEWSPNGLSVSVDGSVVMTAPNPAINDRDTTNCWTGFYDFGEFNPSQRDPWTDALSCHKLMAPFDQKFHFILNVAVGGRWYIPDNCVNAGGEAGRQKPWTNGGGQRDMMQAFYSAQDGWYPTWTGEGDKNAMEIDYVRVYQPVGGYLRTETPEGCPTMPEPDNCPQ